MPLRSYISLKGGKKKQNQSLKNKYFGMYNTAFEMYFKELEGCRIIMQFELSLRKAV